MTQHTMAERIKLARERAELSQVALAKLIGVSRSAVYQWEHGITKQLTAENIVELQRATGVSASWIITGRGAMESIELRAEQAQLLRAAEHLADYQVAIRILDALPKKNGK